MSNQTKSSYTTVAFARLGKEMKLSPKSRVSVNLRGATLTHESESVSLVVGIGNNNVAYLSMSKDAWNALANGEEVNTLTVKDAELKYLNK
jgi:hypothetical protein